MDDEFRSTFPTIAALVDGTGEHRLEVTHSISGDDTIVIIKRTSNNRGFGLLWTGNELRGMRSRTFDASLSDSSPSNADFLEELDRRLAVIGASLHCVEGGAGYAQCAFDAAARSNLKKYRPPRPYPAVQTQLREHAF